MTWVFSVLRCPMPPPTLTLPLTLSVRANARPPLCLVRPSVDSLSRVLTVLRKLIPLSGVRDKFALFFFSIKYLAYISP